MTNVHIVVVEDNPADVLLLKEALKHSGVPFSLEYYTNGEHANRAFTAMTEIPDLILLDLNVSRLNGFELLKIIRNHPVLANSKIAIFTSSLAADDKTRSEQLGANAYIVKPLGYEEFLTKVGRAILELVKDKAGAAGSSGIRTCHRHRWGGAGHGSGSGANSNTVRLLNRSLLRAVQKRMLPDRSFSGMLNRHVTNQDTSTN